MRSKSQRWVVLLGVLILVTILFAFVFVPIAPHGRFSTPQVANMADAYIEASEGKLTQVVFGGRYGREGTEYRTSIGDYLKDNGRWILVTPDGQTGWLRSTILSLKIVADTGQEDGPYYRYEIYKGR